MYYKSVFFFLNGKKQMEFFKRYGIETTYFLDIPAEHYGRILYTSILKKRYRTLLRLKLMLRSRYYFTSLKYIRNIFKKHKNTGLSSLKTLPGITRCESLLYILIYRIGWFSTISQSVLYIKRGCILVNKKIIIYPNYIVKLHEQVELHPIFLYFYFFTIKNNLSKVFKRKLYPFFIFSINYILFQITPQYIKNSPYINDFHVPIDNNRLKIFFRYLR